MMVPALLLRQLYTFGSLENTAAGFGFGVKNRLSNASLLELISLQVDDHDIPLDKIKIGLADSKWIRPADLKNGPPLQFPLRMKLKLEAEGDSLPQGLHKISLIFRSEPFGTLRIQVEDSLKISGPERKGIPRSGDDDYAPEVIRARQEFLSAVTGKKFSHLTSYSFDPHLCEGNIESFIGVAQVPVGLAGPVLVNGEYANGEFYIPLATSEGTLVASYNRGMKVLNMSGGAKCTVIADVMQRAPVFIFEDARKAREFADWIGEHFPEIKEAAEATSHVARLTHIEPYFSNHFVYLRFNYTTGDAAGMNMVGRATFAACSWIIDHFEGIRNFYLEANFATDKKSSRVNMLHTRGKRVTAEAILKREALRQAGHCRSYPQTRSPALRDAHQPRETRAALERLYHRSLSRRRQQ